MTPRVDDQRARARSSTSTRCADLAKTRAAEADRGRRHRLPADHRPGAVPRDRRRGRGAVHVRRRPPRRPHRRRRRTRTRWAWPTSSPSPRTRRCAARAAAPSSAGEELAKAIDRPSSRACRAARSSTSSRPRRWPSPRRRTPEFRDVRRARSSPTPRPWPPALAGEGFRLVSGGTDNHLMLVDLRPFDAELTGKEAQEVLDRAGITLQPQHDPRRPPLAVRHLAACASGTAAETTAGMGADEMADDRRADRPHAARPRTTRTSWPRCAREVADAVRRLPAVPRSRRARDAPVDDRLATALVLVGRCGR